jgi:hypothetical protein
VTADLRERIETLLGSLGETADEVAESLRRRGIKGAPECGDRCPIAMLIRQEVPQSVNDEWRSPMAVDGAWFVERTRTTTPDGPVNNPPAVEAFIRFFDDGMDVRDGERLSVERPYSDLELVEEQ